jgi:uncharacterized protein (TIGR00725 family)
VPGAAHRGASYVAVVGPGEASRDEVRAAEQVGRGLAEAGAVVVCGGLDGVMAAACRGAAGADGLTIAILPGTDRDAANEWARVVIPTGMGEMRNALIVRVADAVIGVGGGYGTLSEVALALKTGVPVVGIETWPIDGIVRAGSAQDAVSRALELAAGGRT